MWRAQFFSVTLDGWIVGGFSLWLLSGVVSVTKSAGFSTWLIGNNFGKYLAAPAINVEDVPSSFSSCPSTDGDPIDSSSDESSVLCDRDDSKWW